MSFEDGFAVGLKLREQMDAYDKNQQMTDMYNRVYHPEMFKTDESNPSTNLPAPPNGFVAKEPTPMNYEKGTGFGGQETMMPKGAMSLSGADGVTTTPLRQEERVLDTSAPKGFATDYTTDYNPTSPYGTTEQTGAQSPADMPYGYGAIPKDYQPQEGVVDTTPTEVPMEQGPQVTIEQGPKFSTMPDDLKSKLANARSEDEYNNILSTYKTPQEPNLYDKTVLEITKAKSEMDTHQEQLSKIRNVADQMRSKGYFKEAENFENKAYETEKALYESTDAYYKTVTKANDIKASLANSYLNAISNGVDNDRAWSELIMKAHKMGIPDLDRYIGLPRDQRPKVAQMVVDDAISTKERLKTESDILKEKNKMDRLNKNLAFKENTNILKDRWHTEDRADRIRALDIKEVTANFKMANAMVANLRADLKMKQDRLNLIIKGDAIKDDFGNIMTPAESQKEATVLTQEIGDMQDRLTAAEAHTNAYREHLPKADLKKIEDANKAEVNQKDAETSAAKMTPDVVNKLVEAINLHPDKIDQIKKTFTSKYPGLKMEDYVKINLPTNQTQVTNVTEDSLVPSENVKPFDILNDISSGTYANRLITVDPLTRSHKVTDFNYSKYSEQTNTMNKEVTISEAFNRLGQSLFDSPFNMNSTLR